MEAQQLSETAEVETEKRDPSDAPSGEGALSVAFLQRRKKGKFRAVEAPRLDMFVADTHAHLQMLQNPAARLARCAIYGVKFICAMTDPIESPDQTYSMVDVWLDKARRLLIDAGREDCISNLPDIRIAIGCHPHNAKRYDDEIERLLIRYLQDSRTCALGEVGLDYHYDLSPRDVQREVFRKQIRLAQKAGLPLVLHMREAHDEGFAILQEEGVFSSDTQDASLLSISDSGSSTEVILHCCNLDPQELKPWIEAGCYISYGGPLTFKKADEVRQGARLVDPCRLLTETDSPYMTPEPLRGMECGPEHTIFTANVMREVCEGNKATQDTVLEQVYHNALSLLNRAPTVWQVKAQDQS